MHCRTALCSILVLATAVSSHAQWNRPMPGTYTWPDSVRILSGARILYGGDLDTDVLLTGKRDTIYTLGPAPEWQQGLALGTDTVTAVAVISGTCLAGTSKGVVYMRALCQNNWDNGRVIPEGATIRAFAGLGDNRFIGTSRGIFVSNWGFVNWDTVNTGLTNLSVTGLVVSGSNLYAVTESVIFVSKDSGAHWSAMGVVRAHAKIRAMAVTGGNLFAATDSGVYRSADSGSTWSASNAGLTNTNAYAFTDTASNLFVATAGGVFRSINNGDSWTAVNDGLTAGPVRAMVRTRNFLYVGKDDGIWARALSQMVTSIARTPAASSGFHIDPTGSISFTLTYPTRVTLTAYTPSGQKAAVLLSQEFPAGAHTQRVDAAALPNGLYVYRLRVGDVTESRTVVRAR
jgi:hypothetical protein